MTALADPLSEDIVSNKVVMAAEKARRKTTVSGDVVEIIAEQRAQQTPPLESLK